MGAGPIQRSDIDDGPIKRRPVTHRRTGQASNVANRQLLRRLKVKGLGHPTRTGGDGADRY